MSPHQEFEGSLPENDDTYTSSAPVQNLTAPVYQEPQKISVSFDSRFMAALLSKIILLVVAGLNLVLARQSIPLLFFGYLTRYDALLLLLQSFFALLITIILGAVVYWLNLLVGRRFNANVTRDGKLTLSRPFSLLQRLLLEFCSLATFLLLLMNVYIYWHYSSIYAYAFGIVGLLVAFCSTLTAVILSGLSLLVSWISYLRGR